MTGQPTEQNEKSREMAWDDRTRALAACLEALLQVHRAQGRPAPAGEADGSSGQGSGADRR